MTKSQKWVTLFWIALGIFVAIHSCYLGLGKLLDPGPGLMPFLLGAILSLLSSIKLIRALRSERPSDGGGGLPGQMPGNVSKIALLTVVLIAYAVLLEPLGYIVTTLLVMVCLLKIAGYKKWRLIITYAVVIVVATYFGFTYLGTIFPPGILRFVGF